jgi:hypothetical protein
MVQYKVVSGRYKRVYDTKKAAKIDYGGFCKKIKKAGEGDCELWFRDGFEDDWTLVEEFGYFDEEEEEEEEDDDDDDDDDDDEQ